MTEGNQPEMESSSDVFGMLMAVGGLACILGIYLGWYAGSRSTAVRANKVQFVAEQYALNNGGSPEDLNPVQLSTEQLNELNLGNLFWDVKKLVSYSVLGTYVVGNVGASNQVHLRARTSGEWKGFSIKLSVGGGIRNTDDFEERAVRQLGERAHLLEGKKNPPSIAVA